MDKTWKTHDIENVFIFIPIISDLYMKKQQFKTFALLNI